MSKKSKIESNLKILQEFSDSSEDEDEAIGEVVNMTFEGFTAEEDDFHGIQRLLAQGFRGLDINLSELAKLTISQNYVGCVIKQVIDDEKEAMDLDDDALEGEPDTESDAVFGVNTVFNITADKKRTAALTSSIRSSVLKKCESSDAPDVAKQLFSRILASEKDHVGLIVNERLINLPPEMSLPAFTTLQSEMEEANKMQMSYTFKYFLIICKTYKISILKDKKKKRKEQQQEQLGNGDSSSNGSQSEQCKTKEVWTNAEEEVFAEFACASFEFCVEDCQSLTAESWNEKEIVQKKARPFRRVLLVPANKFAEAVSKAEMLVAATE